MNEIELKKNIKLHVLKTNKYMTDEISIFLSMPLKKEDATKNALITSVLNRGSKDIDNQQKLNIKLEELYGASLSNDVLTIKENQILFFSLTFLNNKYLPNNENLFEKGLDLIFDILFNPLIKDNKFNEDYLKEEKNNLKEIIKAKVNNKRSYSILRAIEETHKEDNLAVYKYGYIEDIDKIDNEELVNQYYKMINEAKIDIFVSGNINDVEKKINEKIERYSLKDRDYCDREIRGNKDFSDEKYVEEKLNIEQGNLVIGYDILDGNENDNFVLNVYNGILGSGANSKLFQNVREKAHLAYTAMSTVFSNTNVYLYAGIEIENFDKAKDIMIKQVKDIEDGNFNDKDINEAKTLITTVAKGQKESQGKTILFYLGQEFRKDKIDIDEFIEKIEKVSKEDIINFSKRVKLNTIYFLRN